MLKIKISFRVSNLMFELNMRINVIMACSTSHFEMFSKLTLECLHSDLNSPLMSERALVWSQEDTKWGRAPGVKKKKSLVNKRAARSLPSARNSTLKGFVPLDVTGFSHEFHFKILSVSLSEESLTRRVISWVSTPGRCCICGGITFIIDFSAHVLE